MKKKLLIGFLIIFAAVVTGNNIVHAKPIKLRVGHDLPPFTTPGMGIDAWAKEVNQKTQGRVIVEVYPASTLAEQKGGVEMLQAGVADCYMVGLGTHRKLFPVSDVVNMQGLGFPDTVKGHKAHAAAFLRLIDKYPQWQKEFEDYVIIFDMINSNNILLSASKEIHLPSDMKGLKVGATGRSGEFVKKMGGASVFSIPPLAYQNIQTGVLDAQPIHYLAIGEFKLYEVAKFAHDLTWSQGQIPLMMNKRSWNKLSPEDQKIVMEAGLIGQQVAFEAAEKRTLEGRQAFLAAGGTIVTPTAEEKAIWMQEFSSLWEEWIKDVESIGITSGRAIMNDWKQAVESFQL